MAITMQPDRFLEHRRQDPKRAAEARVFDALQNLDLNGHGLYEFRYRRDGRQVDYPLWIHSMARLAVSVKGGSYEMDSKGRWFLRTPDGSLEPVPSPLEEAVDGGIEMRNAIREAVGAKNFVAALLIFPDMPRNEHLERVALNRDLGHIIFGLDNLEEDLERIAKEAKFYYPPKPEHSENEWRRVNLLQYQGAEAPMGGGQQPRVTHEKKAMGHGLEGMLAAESITINIQHVERLEVRHYHLGRDADGNVVLPQA